MMVEKPEVTDKEKALRAVKTLYNAIYGRELFTILPGDIYDARNFLEGYIESAIQPPKPPKWVRSDKPFSEHSIDGFTLKDEVKVVNSDARWFVVGLDFRTNEIILNMKDYYDPFLQERYTAESLTLVSHGRDE